MAESEVRSQRDTIELLFDYCLQERIKKCPSSFYMTSFNGIPVTIDAHQRGGKELAKSRRRSRSVFQFIEQRGTRSRWFCKKDESKELILSNEIFDVCFDLITAFRAEQKGNSRKAWNEIANCTYGLHQQDFQKIWNLVREHPGCLDGTQANFTGCPQSQVVDSSIRLEEAQDEIQHEMDVLDGSADVADDTTAHEDWEKIQRLRNHFQTYIDLEAKGSRGNSTCAFYEGAQYAVKVLQILQKSKRLEVVPDCADSMQAARTGPGPPFLVVEEHERYHCESPMKEFWEKFNPKESTATIKYSRKDKDRWGGQHTLNSKIIAQFQARQAQHATLRDLTKHNISDFLPPFNCLNMAYTGPPRMPVCLKPQRYNILQELNNRLNMGDTENTTNRPTKRKEPTRHTDFVDGLRFTLLTQSDAVSFIHCDRHALGTYGISVAGEKLWIMITFNSPQAQARYQEQCQNFDFQDCELHWTFLNPGKIVVMLRSVPHIVITTKDSLFYGGSFWDGEDLIGTLKDLKQEFGHSLRTTNESAAKQLPEVLRKLGEMCEDQSWMKAFKIKDEEAFWKVWRDALDVVEGKSKKKAMAVGRGSRKEKQANISS